jgi:hypothetical protein
MEKLKKQVVTATSATKRIIQNAEQFVQAVSLLVVAGFSYYAQSRVGLSNPARLAVIVALVIIGLRGAVEFINFLNKKG